MGRNKVLAVLTGAVCTWMCITACGNETAIYYSGGQDIYRQKCANCHGTTGDGLQALIPSLHNLQSKVKREQLACIIKLGKRGDAGNDMPPNPDMADIDIAKVIVYITNSFNNKLGHYDYKRVTADLTRCK